MRRLLVCMLFASCSCVSTSPVEAAVDGSVDASLADAAVDAGDGELHVFDVDPPPGWSDAGHVTWRLLEFAEYCGPLSGRLHAQINNHGTMLIGCGSSPSSSADDTLVLRDGGTRTTSGQNWTYQLLEDDTYWGRDDQNLSSEFVIRKSFDGGVIMKLPFKKTLAATVSGWLSLEHWGTYEGNPWEVWGPDGGVWYRERPRTYVVKFNEAGVGVGATNLSDALYVFKDGEYQYSKCYASRGCGPADINETNLIVGDRADPYARATLFWGRDYHEATLSVGQRASFSAVNNAAVAVGMAYEVDFPSRAIGWGFAWSKGHTVVLEDLVRDAGYDCIIHNATDINDLNEIVGLASCGDAGVEPHYSYYRLKLGIEH